MISSTPMRSFDAGTGSRWAMATLVVGALGVLARPPDALRAQAEPAALDVDEGAGDAEGSREARPIPPRDADLAALRAWANDLEREPEAATPQIAAALEQARRALAIAAGPGATEDEARRARGIAAAALALAGERLDLARAIEARDAARRIHEAAEARARIAARALERARAEALGAAHPLGEPEEPRIPARGDTDEGGDLE